MPPSARRLSLGSTILLTTTALLTPTLVGTATGAHASQPARISALSTPGETAWNARTSSETHPLVPAARVPGVLTLGAADAAQARDDADGQPVHVVSASSPVAVGHVAVAGITWKADATEATTQYRTETEGTWSEWETVESEQGHAPDGAEATRAASKLGGPREGTAPIVVTDADHLQVRVVAADGATPADAELMVVDPGTTSTQPATTTQPTTSTSTTTAATTRVATTTEAATTASTTSVAKPQIYTRAEWGADESLRDPSEPDYGVVDLAVVHHTAGSNTYVEADVPAILRGIYEYHVTGNGWRDIGYNFLIDRFGRTWEGRYGGMDKAVVGAHARGVNAESFGASVLGNFETARPPAAVGTALRNLIAWKADIHRFDVLGQTQVDGITYDNISGHRDVNQTECPGQYLYATLPALRTATAALSPAATRVAGSNRYATAARVSAASFAPGVPVAYVATGANFPDALAGGAAGGHRGGPVLLTTRDTLPAETKTELQRLRPGRIIVLGGTGAVSNGVAAALSSVAPVERIAGINRFATAAQVSAKSFGSGAPVAYVATGSNFPDALSGGPAGGFRGGPVLLTNPTSLPQPTASELTRLKPASIVVLGGGGTVSEAVLSQLRGYAPTVQRIAGSNRYATAARTSASTFAPGVGTVFVATGTNFPDALAGGAAGGHLGGPVLLTNTDSLPTATIDELRRLAPARIKVLGGAGTVAESVAKRLYNYEVPPGS